MAPLPQMCRHASAIRAMQSQGRYDEALKLLLSQLVSGTASSRVQAIAAEMLAPKEPGAPRGPKRKTPYKWLEIGHEYDELVDDGVPETEARLILAERHPRGRRTIDTIIAFYNKANAEYQASLAEEFDRDSSK